MHYHRFRGSLYNFSLVSGKRDLARCYFRNVGDPHIAVNYAEIKINFHSPSAFCVESCQIYPILSARDGMDFTDTVSVVSVQRKCHSESFCLVSIVHYVLHSHITFAGNVDKQLARLP